MTDPTTIRDIPDTIRPESLIALCRRVPHLVEEFRRAGEAELAAAIETGDVVRLRAAMMRRVMLKTTPPSPPTSSSFTYPPIGHRTH